MDNEQEYLYPKDSFIRLEGGTFEGSELRDDLRIDTYRFAVPDGPGTEPNHVRITHIPTGIVTFSDVPNVAYSINRDIALQLLEDRLAEGR